MARANEKKIILIGMAGSGKSTLARELSDALLRRADRLSRRYGDISVFRAKRGEQELEKSLRALRQAGDLVYLYAPIELLKSRTDFSAHTLDDGFFSRCNAVYERYADYTVDVSSGNVLQKTLDALRIERPNRYGVLLCDADDTVLDFGAAMRIAMINLKKAFGLRVDDETLISSFHKCTTEAFGRLERGEIERATLGRFRFDMLCDMLGESIDGEKANEFFFGEIMKNRIVRAGALEFLDGVRARGIKVYIVTNSFAHVAAQRLKALEGHIDGAFVSESIGFDKPNVKYFEAVCDAIGRPDKRDILILGDSNTSDIAGGKNFGIDTCFFDPSGQKPTLADYRAEDYAEVSELL